MKIDDLLRPGMNEAAWVGAVPPEMDPLRENDALQDAQVIDLRFDVLAGVVGILFDLRQAFQLREASTGVLVARGVRELTWSGPRRDTPLTAWSVCSLPRIEGDLFGLTLDMWPSATLLLNGARAAFFVGEVPGLPEAPPDYTGRDRSSINGEVADWQSDFILTGAVFLEAPPAAP